MDYWTNNEGWSETFVIIIVSMFYLFTWGGFRPGNYYNFVSLCSKAMANWKRVSICQQTILMPLSDRQIIWKFVLKSGANICTDNVGRDIEICGDGEEGHHHWPNPYLSFSIFPTIDVMPLLRQHSYCGRIVCDHHNSLLKGFGHNFWIRRSN